MDIFVFNNTTNYISGEIVNGLKSVLWVERYREPGEFKFVGLPTDELRTILPLGALVSHSETLDVMMVENHEIDEEKEGNTELIISGRSLSAFLEQRVATGNALGIKDPTTDVANLYKFAAGNSWDQAVALLKAHIQTSVLNSMDNLPSVQVVDEISGTESPQNERVIKRGPLYPAFISILESIDAGIRIERPMGAISSLNFIIHLGVDRQDTVRFSWDAGDIKKGKYFWSNKSEKNGAYVISQYSSSVVRPTGVSGFDVRLMFVDASDYDAKPATTAPAEIARVLTARGLEALGNQKTTRLLEATVASTTKSVYRKDYNIGDIVYVVGNYDVYSPMRVKEYAETWDTSGETGYPTLTAL